jgi:predicted membrane metal-binding protein
MATGTPLNRLTLSAASVADDLGYVALSDLARVLGSVRAESAEVIRSLFGDRHNAPMAALTSGQRLSADAADIRLTRMRALIAHVLGPA